MQLMLCTMIGMDLLRSQRGMLAQIARGLGCTRSAVAMWKRVPAERLPDVERITGIPRYLLRPDICPPPITAPAGDAGGPVTSACATQTPLATIGRNDERPVNR